MVIKTSPLLSEQLSQFLGFLRTTIKDYQYYSAQLTETEMRERDILHFLELDSSGYRERYKVATLLRQILRERRVYKDRVEELSHIAEFLTENKLMDKLGRILGDIRRVERYHQNRAYIPKRISNPFSNPGNGEKAIMTITNDKQNEEP